MKKKPTVEELEKFLEEKEETAMRIMPDGSVVADADGEPFFLPPKILSLDDVLKDSTY